MTRAGNLTSSRDDRYGRVITGGPFDSEPTVRGEGEVRAEPSRQRGGALGPRPGHLLAQAGGQSTGKANDCEQTRQELGRSHACVVSSIRADPGGPDGPCRTSGKPHRGIHGGAGAGDCRVRGGHAASLISAHISD